MHFRACLRTETGFVCSLQFRHTRHTVRKRNASQSLEVPFEWLAAVAAQTFPTNDDPDGFSKNRVRILMRCTKTSVELLGVLYNEENSMLETAFNSSVDVAKARMASRGVQLNVVSQIVPLYDSFGTQHFGKLVHSP